MVLARCPRKQAHSRYFGICDCRFDQSSSCRQRLAATTMSLLCRPGYLRDQQRGFAGAQSPGADDFNFPVRAWLTCDGRHPLALQRRVAGSSMRYQRPPHQSRPPDRRNAPVPFVHALPTIGRPAPQHVPEVADKLNQTTALCLPPVRLFGVAVDPVQVVRVATHLCRQSGCQRCQMWCRHQRG
jgi:hypothetical protein